MSPVGPFTLRYAPGSCLLLVVSVVLAQAAPAERPPKVEPRVWQDTENGRKARFLVLLTEQTNTIRKAKGDRDARADRRSVVAGVSSPAGPPPTEFRPPP